MKNITRLFYILLLFIFSFACGSNKTNLKTDTIHINTDTVNAEFISGTVNEIQHGKDGYTAKITTLHKAIYFATISTANLKDPSQYKSAQVGDTLTVKGDVWKMGNEDHITVREMK